MGYAYVQSPCCACGRVFFYNPVWVPSIRLPSTGQKEPVCPTCIQRANVERLKNGLQPLVPHPQAYEPIAEEELP